MANVTDSLKIQTLYSGPHQQQALIDAHYHLGHTATQGDLDTANGQWQTDIVPKLIQLLGSNWRIIGVRVAPDVTPEGIKSEYFYPSPPAGAGDPAEANGVAAVISLKTARTGKSFRGRMYLPGIPNSAVHDDVIDGSAWLTAGATLLNALLAFDPAAGGGTNLFQVVSRKLGVSAHVIAAVIDTLIGYQRRRTRNVGHHHSH